MVTNETLDSIIVIHCSEKATADLNVALGSDVYVGGVDPYQYEECDKVDDDYREEDEAWFKEQVRLTAKHYSKASPMPSAPNLKSRKVRQFKQR